eukprot:gene482-6892_t
MFKKLLTNSSQRKNFITKNIQKYSKISDQIEKDFPKTSFYKQQKKTIEQEKIDKPSKWKLIPQPLKVTTFFFIGLPMILSSSYLMFTLQTPIIFLYQLKFASILLGLCSGIFWGFNLKDYKPNDENSIPLSRLLIGFLPVIVSFSASIADPVTSMVLLVLGFLSMLPLNYQWSKLGLLSLQLSL